MLSLLTSFKNLQSRLITSNAASLSAKSPLPTYHSSQSTLFDDLTETEKQAALVKLQKLASAQPQPGTTLPTKTSRRTRFNIKTCAMVFLGLGFIIFAVIASVALAIDTDKDPDLVAKLRMANTNLDRLKLLPDDSDWFFDFTKQDVSADLIPDSTCPLWSWRRPASYIT
jgi:hypothetical protein